MGNNRVRFVSPGSGWGGLASAVAMGGSAAQHIPNPRTARNKALADMGYVVYAIQTDDMLVKFGRSENLARRLRSYKIPMSSLHRLLMVMPGSASTERSVLAMFRPYLARKREYFHPAPPVLYFINQVRDRMGVPPLSPDAFK